jgi:hypothetical protein
VRNPSLEAHRVEALLDNRSWHERKALFALLGADAGVATALGYSFGPDPLHPEYAFLAAAAGGLRRSFVVLKPDALSVSLVAFDLVPAPSATFQLEGFAEPAVRGSEVTAALPGKRAAMKASILLPGGQDATIEAAQGGIAISRKRASPESLFLCVMQFAETASHVEFVGSVDLAGVRIGHWVVLSHNEVHSAREPQFFFVERSGPVKCLVTGLAPGAWELWHNGFVTEPSLEVNPRAGALYFEGDAGNYFFRRYS